ncbi:MAG TPA: DUF5683 domain-containing protein [Cytophagaceae bacterium]|jgi:hypothetical protein|nr:DUF5683 domain-containing protein [Cytophagaceae bacterium]
MRTFLAVAVFLFVNMITGNSLLAQQKDSVMLNEIDSLNNLTVPSPRDSVFFGPRQKEQDAILGNAVDSIIRSDVSQDSLKKVAGRKTLRDSSFVIVENEKHKKWSRPKKTMIMAMILPGSGQAYNHKYWKLPILYAGIGAVVYFWTTNQKLYREFKNEYTTQSGILANNPTYQVDYFSKATGNVYTSVDQLASDRDTYRRYRDMSIAGAVILYGISVLDAYVDAHLRDFDLNPDLSVSIKPMFYKNNTNFVTGLSLSLNFKNNRIRPNQLLRKDF